MELDGVNNNTEQLQNTSDTEGIKVNFDGKNFSVEGLGETDPREERFSEMLDTRKSEVLQEFRESEEFAEKKEELSRLDFGEVASLHEDKIKYLDQCTEEYKEQYLAGESVSPEDMEAAQQTWEEALKEYAVNSAVLGEKQKEGHEQKEETWVDKVKDVAGKAGAVWGIATTLSAGAPESTEDVAALFGKYMSKETKPGIERSVEEGNELAAAEADVISAGPEPPEKDQYSVQASFAVESDWKFEEQTSPGEQNVTITYNADLWDLKKKD